MSRARRSPPPAFVFAGQSQYLRQDYDADQRRAAASQGFAGRTKHHPSGGLSISQGEYRLLFLIVLLACGVRLFRLSKPDSVV